jgi:hypothetical protein
MWVFGQRDAAAAAAAFMHRYFLHLCEVKLEYTCIPYP